MSELIDRSVLKARMYSAAFESDTDMQRWDSGCWIRYKLFENIVDNMPTVPYTTRWRRVEEELPEPHRGVLVSGMEAINNSRVYKVMVNDNGTWRPTDYAPSIRWDYWMPIEPPKEGNNGSSRKEASSDL